MPEREMKDSGIQWIGEIPIDWKIVPVKYFFNINRGRVISVLDLDEDGRYPVYSSQTENNGIFGYINTFDFSGPAITWTTDGAKAGTVFLRDGQYNCTNVCGILIFKNSNYRLSNIQYLTYAIGAAAEQNKRKDINGYKIMSNEMAKIRFAIPSLQQQRCIADFLDKKCSQIDEISKKIQEEIETLEEYKKSVIYSAVCNGIDNEELIDTGDEYWKKMPNGWALVDIKYLFEIVKRIAGREGYPVLSITQRGLKVKDTESNEGQLAADYSNYQFVYPGDFAMNHMDLLTGWVDLSNQFGVTSPDYRVFKLRNTKKYNREYYKYVMQCCYQNKIFYSLGQGVSNLGRWRLQTESFNNFRVPVPPTSTQIKIGEYLSSTISKIDDSILKKNNQLKILEDYKRSLIYEYVTGKKEVPIE